MLVAERLFCEGCYRISIISAFLCRRAKKNSNTLHVDRALLPITLQKMKTTQRANVTNESTQAKIIRYLPAWGFPEGVEQLFGVTHHGTFEFL